MLATDRQQKAIEITGIMPAQTVKMQLAFLRQEGILVDLNITGTGMFLRTPDWAELGIPDFAGDRRATQFTKGGKYLYPERKVSKLKSFESRLRQNLDKHSYEVTGFRPYRWIGYTAYQAWRERHDQIVAEANQYIQDELIAPHSACVDEIASNYAEIAEAAWLSLTTGESDKGRRTIKYTRVIIPDRHTHKDLTLGHDEFVDYIVSNAVRQIPTVEEIETKLRFDYTTALVYGEEDAANDEAAAANVRAQIDFQREKASLENEALREQVRASAWANQFEQNKKQELLDAMRRAEYDHHREQLRETVSPFVEVYQQAMSQFIEHARDMLESIQKNSHVRGKVAEKGRGLLDIYNLMVIPGMGDDRMMACLKDLRALLGPVDDKASRDPDKIVSKLQDILALEADVAAGLMTEPTTFGYIEV